MDDQEQLALKIQILEQLAGGCRQCLEKSGRSKYKRYKKDWDVFWANILKSWKEFETFITPLCYGRCAKPVTEPGGCSLFFEIRMASGRPEDPAKWDGRYIAWGKGLRARIGKVIEAFDSSYLVMRMFPLHRGSSFDINGEISIVDDCDVLITHKKWSPVRDKHFPSGGYKVLGKAKEKWDRERKKRRERSERRKAKRLAKQQGKQSP